jgi:HAD superfamily hydrolase (TIGR01549 family)
MDKNSDLKNKKLLAFDLYGTCIDHPFKGWLSWDLIEIMEKNPITMQDVQEWKIEKNWIKFQISNELIEYIKNDIKWTILFPETLEALKYIKSKWYQTAVVSNLSKDYAEPLYKLIPEWIFDYEVLSFDVWAAKPDPKIYEYLKSLSWIDFQDIIMIGDSLKSDVVWSSNVWITPIHLNRDDEWIKEVHKKWIDFIQISTLADLKELF